MSLRTILLAFVLLAAPAVAATPAVTVSDAWMRALPGNLPAAGYFILHNNSNHGMTLVGAESPACGMAMLHKSETMGGMAHMSDEGAIEVPAKGTLSFAPGGYHVMCMSPSAAVKPGGTVSMTLRFSDGTRLTAPFAVRNAAGK